MYKKLALLILGTLLFLVLGACGNNNDMDNAFNGYGNNQQGGGMYNEEISPYTDISSDSTTLSSKEFPHTKAVQIQEAKFEYRVDVNQQQTKVNHNVKIGRGQGQAGAQPAQKAPAPEAGNQGTTQQNEQQAPAEQPKQETPVEQAPPAQEAKPEQQTEQPPQQTAEGLNDFERRVIELTNEQRRNNGLSELQGDAALSNVARTKSADMQENNYFSHTSPTYGSPFDMIRDFGVSYSAAAENIAQGQQSPEQVVESWMNSEGHRKNILNGNFTHIGVGYVANGHHWTQMFITK